MQGVYVTQRAPEVTLQLCLYVSGQNCPVVLSASVNVVPFFVSLIDIKKVKSTLFMKHAFIMLF